MKLAKRVIVLLTLLALSGCAPEVAPPAPRGRDMVFEGAVVERLKSINPAAVPVFQRATEAGDRLDLEAARAGYLETLALAPDFPDALRRLSAAESRLGQIEPAIAHARRAVAIDRSGYNLSALAEALSASKQSDAVKEALPLAQEGARLNPDDAFAQAILLQAAVAARDSKLIRQSDADLLRLAPEHPTARAVAGLLAAEDGDWERAESELLAARSLGMPAESIQEILDQGVTTQARLRRALRYGGLAILAWLAGIVALFALGATLSRLTVRALERPDGGIAESAQSVPRFVRRLYRLTIILASVYFYVSIPFVVLIVIVATAGGVLLILSLGLIPMQLLTIVVVFGLYTLIGIGRSIFVRLPAPDLGRRVAPEEAPALWAISREVADHMGTRPADIIAISPGAGVAVLEEGSMLQKARGNGKRCLVVGMAAFDGLTQTQFKAILAHEYGHFLNRDTSGGRLALQVEASIERMAESLIHARQNYRLNPAWLFLNGFIRIFKRITQGASRLQEALADRAAALAYGGQTCIDGLTQAIRQMERFYIHAQYSLDREAELRLGLSNIYQEPTLPDALQTKADGQIKEELERATGPYDSHPAPRERIRYLRQFSDMAHMIRNDTPALDLLLDPKALQIEMTRKLSARTSGG